MEGSSLSAGVTVEEIEHSAVLEEFSRGLSGAFKDGFVRFQPSGQVRGEGGRS